LSFAIINMCLISAVMALGVNIQWGYAGLFNVGIMGFAALGGVAAMLVSTKPVTGAWSAGGINMLMSFVALIATAAIVIFMRRKMRPSKIRALSTFAIIVIGIFVIRRFYLPAVDAIEDFEPAQSGFLVGGCFRSGRSLAGRVLDLRLCLERGGVFCGRLSCIVSCCVPVAFVGVWAWGDRSSVVVDGGGDGGDAGGRCGVGSYGSKCQRYCQHSFTRAGRSGSSEGFSESGF